MCRSWCSKLLAEFQAAEMTAPDDLTYTQSELAAQIMRMAHRRRVDMLRGFSGSASPSNATKYGFGVTTPSLALFGRWLLSSPPWCQVYPSAPAFEWCDSILFRPLLSCDHRARLLVLRDHTVSSSFDAEYSVPSNPITFSSSPSIGESWCLLLLSDSLVSQRSGNELSLLLMDCLICAKTCWKLSA